MKKVIPPLCLALAYCLGLYGIWLSPLKPSAGSMAALAGAFFFGWLAVRTGQEQE